MRYGENKLSTISNLERLLVPAVMPANYYCLPFFIRKP
ncbi:hypothetical protein SAMN05518672_10632 [Chitinophaga sp. CF118]|nr:hypothetical protein SAMN05518672_10632 [Chitinophaga sp. CF118]